LREGCLLLTGREGKGMGKEMQGEGKGKGEREGEGRGGKEGEGRLASHTFLGPGLLRRTR